MSTGIIKPKAWTASSVQAIHDLPFLELVWRAQRVHRQHFNPMDVQLCTLLSIKTGGCPENCAYCPQSAHHNTGLSKERLQPVESVLKAARTAQARGSTRFCLGAAWRQVRDGSEFESVLEMVAGISSLGMEACCTLGMLTGEQAHRLKRAGLKAYNHNLDTGPAYYERIVSTRVYAERLATLRNVAEAGITVCCGGILGMGESVADRIDLLTVLAGLDPQPESVPINALVRIAGTPLENAPPIDIVSFVRVIATARIIMPSSRVRLSAGRDKMSDESQALCFLAGANSIHTGNKLLTTPTFGHGDDHAMLARLGLRPEAAAAPVASVST
jgi:biotin synthase